MHAINQYQSRAILLDVSESINIFHCLLNNLHSSIGRLKCTFLQCLVQRICPPTFQVLFSKQICQLFGLPSQKNTYRSKLSAAHFRQQFQGQCDCDVFYMGWGGGGGGGDENITEKLIFFGKIFP